MNDCHSLGTAHGLRDAAVISIAQRQTRARRGTVQDLTDGWPGIVTALRTHVAAYNTGIGHVRLVVTETERPDRVATIESTAAVIPTLVVALDDAERRVECPDTTPRDRRITRWVAMTRTDNDTAASVLQDWMERQ